MPAPARSRPRRRLAAVVAGLAVALAGLGTPIAAATPAAAAATVPGTVLPDGSGDGADVTIAPGVVRARGGHAELAVAVGAAAPGDVVVELALVQPEVSADGVVTPGTRAAEGRLTSGARLQPGERLLVTVTGITATAVVVAEISPTGPQGDAGQAEQLAALVLPGQPGQAPHAALEVVADRLRGTVTVTAPALVTARLAGAEVVTHPERLVLPDQPLVLTGAPARWPTPSELVVTDDAGHTARADTGREALAAIAAVLVALALAAMLLAARPWSAPHDRDGDQHAAAADSDGA